MPLALPSHHHRTLGHRSRLAHRLKALPRQDSETLPPNSRPGAKAPVSALPPIPATLQAPASLHRQRLPPEAPSYQSQSFPVSTNFSIVSAAPPLRRREPSKSRYRTLLRQQDCPFPRFAHFFQCAPVKLLPSLAPVRARASRSGCIPRLSPSDMPARSLPLPFRPPP